MKYLGMNLTSEDRMYFENAVNFQETAILELKESQDIINFIYYMEKAFDEYKMLD